MRAEPVDLSTRPAPATPAYAWYGLAVLVTAYALSFLDRHLLSLLVEPIKRDLAINDTQLSLLHGLAFALTLSLAGLPAGRYADRGQRVGLVAAGIALWSLTTAACGLARSFPVLALCRMGVGIGEATLTPAAYSMLSDWFPRHRLGLALGLYSMGIHLGGGLALFLGGVLISRTVELHLAVPLLGTLHGWQLVFIAVGLPGLLVALWMATLREPPRRDDGGPLGSPPLAAVYRHLRSHARPLLSLVLCMAFAAMMNYAANAWVPSILIRTHGWSASEAAQGYGLLVIVAGVPGVIAGGWLGDRLATRNVGGARAWVMSGAALAAAPCVALAPLAGSAAEMLALLGPATLLVTMVIGGGPAAVQELLPARMRGTVSAFGVLIVNLLGLGIGPTCVAAISDYALGDARRINQALAMAAPCMLVTAAAFGLIAGTGRGALPR